MDGEIDLSTCYNVTEYQAQRNYGFQIHVRRFEGFVLLLYPLLKSITVLKKSQVFTNVTPQSTKLDEADLLNKLPVCLWISADPLVIRVQTQEGVHTLSAMTAGIRRNWIQAVMKNVRPSTAPDVARSVPAGPVGYISE